MCFDSEKFELELRERLVAEFIWAARLIGLIPAGTAEKAKEKS